MDFTVYSLDMGFPVADVVSEDLPLPSEEVEPQREAA